MANARLQSCKACAWLLLALVVCATAPGCVERRLLIRSSPAGALVKVDDAEVGRTPVSVPFIYYGTRKIQLVKDGYETLTLLQPIPTPAYDMPGVDFVTENFVPGKIRDVRVLDYQRRPAAPTPTKELLERAGALRQNAQSAVPLPAGIPVPAGPGYPPGVVPVQPLPAPQPLPPPPPGPQFGQPQPQLIPAPGSSGGVPDSSLERLPR